MPLNKPAIEKQRASLLNLVQNTKRNFSKEDKVGTDNNNDVPSAKNSKFILPEKLPLPAEFICPISNEILEDPVTDAEGKTYSRKFVEALEPEKKPKVLIPNLFAKEQIENYKKNGQLIPKEDQIICPLSCEVFVKPKLISTGRTFSEGGDKVIFGIKDYWENTAVYLDPEIKQLATGELIPNKFAEKRVEAYESYGILFKAIEKQDLEEVKVYFDSSAGQIKLTLEIMHALQYARQLPDKEITLYIERQCSEMYASENAFVVDQGQGQKQAVEKRSVNKNININEKNSRGRTALHEAAASQQYEVVRSLLAQPTIDPNIADVNGDLAIDLLCESIPLENKKAEVKKLIEELLKWLLKGQPNEKLFDGFPLRAACMMGRPKVVKFLVEVIKFPEEEIHAGFVTAILGKDLSTVKTMLQYKINIETNCNGNRFVHFAAITGVVRVMQLLKEKGADLGTRDKAGDSALHLACVKGRMEMVNFLLNYIPVDISNSRTGATPLFSAVVSGHMELIKLLKDKNAQFHMGDKNKQNPLHYLILYSTIQPKQKRKVAALLLEYGVKAEEKDRFGKSPFDYAAEKELKDVVFDQAVNKYKSFNALMADVSQAENLKQNPIPIENKGSFNH